MSQWFESPLHSDFEQRFEPKEEWSLVLMKMTCLGTYTGSDLNGDVSVEIMPWDRDHPQKAEIDQIEAEGANNQWSLNSDVFNGANGIVDIITTATNEGLEFSSVQSYPLRNTKMHFNHWLHLE